MQRPTFAIALALALSLPVLATAMPVSAQDFDPAGEQQILARINAMRSAQSLAPLIRLQGLDAAARAHSADMATQQQLSHVSDSSGTPANRVRSAGVTATAVAENVALHRNTELAHEALLSSTPHRANMMSADSTHIGLAALRTDQGVYVTQVYATVGPPPAAEAAPTPPAAAPAGSPIVAPGIVPQTAPPAQGLLTPPPGTPAPPSAPPSAAAPRAQAAPAAPRTGAPQGGSLVPQPGSNGTVIIHRNDQNTVIAYWVFGNGRWWYYPFTPNARPGTQLQADRSVQGPPPGYPANPTGGTVAGRPQAHRIPPPPGTRFPGVPSLGAPPPGARAWNVPPAPGQGQIVIQPFQGRATVQPGTTFYATPPPPMTGRPTRAFRRQQRQWQRAYRRWQREQARLRRRTL